MMRAATRNDWLRLSSLDDASVPNGFADAIRSLRVSQGLGLYPVHKAVLTVDPDGEVAIVRRQTELALTISGLHDHGLFITLRAPVR